MLRPLLLSLISTALAIAQSAPNSITVTATRTVEVPPDLVTFQISISSKVEATRDEVAGALSGAGITATLTSVRVSEVNTRTGPVTSLEWSFKLADQLSNMKSALDTLAAAQKSLTQSKGYTMGFQVTGTNTSAKAQQAQSCSIPDLLADARVQAQKLAAAAAASLGPILAISGGTDGPDPSNASAFAPPTFYPVCSLTVKYALGTL